MKGKQRVERQPVKLRTDWVRIDNSLMGGPVVGRHGETVETAEAWTSLHPLVILGTLRLRLK